MLKTTVSIIVAMDEKRGIGKGSKLLFKIPEDMKRMKDLTTGHPLIMGRKTFESLGRLLPNRTHIVITRDVRRLDSLNYKPHYIVSSIEEAIEVGEKIEDEAISGMGSPRYARDDNKGEVFIFGGAQVYTETLKKDLADRIYLTVVKGDYGADVFFPEYSGFKITKSEERAGDGFNYIFLDLEK